MEDVVFQSLQQDMEFIKQQGLQHYTEKEMNQAKLYQLQTRKKRQNIVMMKETISFMNFDTIRVVWDQKMSMVLLDLHGNTI